MIRRFPYRWVIAGILFFAYSVQYLDRVIATVLTPLFAKDIGLTTADIGTGAFLMMIFYAPAQVVSGVLTDRFGAKRLLLFSIIAWSLMAGWMGLIKSQTEYFYRMALFGLLIRHGICPLGENPDALVQQAGPRAGAGVAFAGVDPDTGLGEHRGDAACGLFR